tara:strand:- start:1242 stop:1907 length:666 start_codon:yes stop_codon:yes gene_type:complete
MNDKYGYLYIYIFILALIFYIIANYETNILISLIIIILIGYFFYLKIDNDLINNKFEETIIKNKINKNIENVQYFNSLNPNINKVPKEFKYLLNDKILTEIILDINLINKFNKTLYIDILINFDKLMKIYIYILTNIYDPKIYISSFIETRIIIIKLLDSSKLNIPIISKYTIGFNLHDKIDKNILLFKMRTRKMNTIINNYAKYEKKIRLDDIEFLPSNL